VEEREEVDRRGAVEDAVELFVPDLWTRWAL
jgi:hypothetical protein